MHFLGSKTIFITSILAKPHGCVGLHFRKSGKQTSSNDNQKWRLLLSRCVWCKPNELVGSYWNENASCRIDKNKKLLAKCARTFFTRASILHLSSFYFQTPFPQFQAFTTFIINPSYLAAISPSSHSFILSLFVALSPGVSGNFAELREHYALVEKRFTGW